MDTLMTIIPIAVAIASGVWIAHSRKHNKPWIRTWLKAMTVLIGVPIGAWCLFMVLGFTDADVKWLIAPLTFIMTLGLASFASAVFLFLIDVASNIKFNTTPSDNKSRSRSGFRLKAPSPFLILFTFRTWF